MEGEIVPFGKPKPASVDPESSRAVARYIREILAKRFQVGQIKAAPTLYVDLGQADRIARFDIPEPEWNAIKEVLCGLYGVYWTMRGPPRRSDTYMKDDV